MLLCLLKTLFSFSFVALEEKRVNGSVFYALGAVLVVVGIIIIVIAIVIMSMRDAGEGKVKGAGIIMIGPIPIIFGTDKKSVKSVLVLALALTIALIIFMVIYYWMLR
jgi:uncharacterized protein (TIGR00304 family)